MLPAVAAQDAENNPPTVKILPDGSLEPTTYPIQRYGNVYTFTGNVYASIIVDCDNIVIDGSGYTLEGTYNGTRTDDFVVGKGPDQDLSPVPWTMGIDLARKGLQNLTVCNLNIRNFYVGIYLWTSHNTLQGCSVTDNIVGILLSGDSNRIMENHIARNEQGIFFGVNTPGDEPLDIVLAHNAFVDNDVHFSGCFCENPYTTDEEVHTWDYGGRGNYWSDYTGTDADGDGIGDTPYIIDVLNQDRYPLMHASTTQPTPTTHIPVGIIVLAAALAVIVVAIVLSFFKRRKTP
ncbi:MAG: hypothetical protein NWF04_06815 [Candidatus Bathyarchaeota archaeon]|nr:hypothetical protein [Candidatus Bathyarchaeota archaeon]